MKKFLTIFLIGFVLFPQSLAAQETLFAPQVLLTLDETLAIALRDNRDVRLKAADVEKAKQKIAENKAGLLPTLTFTASETVTTGLYDKSLDQTTTQTTFKQYLYKGGKTVNSIEQSKQKLAVSQALLEKTRLETALQVTKAFYTLLLAEAFADLNKGIVENTQEHLQVLTVRYQRGLASELDVLKVKESLETVRQAYLASLNQVESTQSLLRNLLYLDERTAIKPDGEFVYEPREMAYDEAFVKALEMRPEIRQYEAQLKVDKKSIEITKADNRPSVYASWDYYSRSHLTGTTTANWNDYGVAGITFSWPIFDGWATKAKLDQAIVDLKETELMKEKVIKDIALELTKAQLFLKNSIAQIKAAQADLVFYENNLTNFKEKYTKGIASLLDVQDAALSRQVSLFNKNQAIYNYVVARSDFDKATGGS